MANAVVTVLEADGVTETDVTVLDVGRQAAAASKSVALATEDKAVADAIQTSVQLIDDAIFTDDAAFTPGTSKVMMAGAQFDDGSPDSVNEGDAGAVRMSANRNLYVTIRDSAGNERGLAIDASGRIGVVIDPSTVNANGRAAAADSAPTVMSTEDKAALDAVSAKLASYSASATFTPAASSHVAGDVNGGAQEFSSIGPSAGRVMINSATLEIDGGTVEATAWRLALFNVTPPSAVSDDGAFTLPSGDRASFLGFIELGAAADEGDTQWVEVHGINKQVKLSGTSIFAYLINRTTLTPANVAHIVTLHATVL